MAGAGASWLVAQFPAPLKETVGMRFQVRRSTRP